MLRIELQEGSGRDAFDQIRDEWHRLYQSVSCSPFLSWEWMSTWYQHFGENRSAVLIKAYRDDELIGILPMYRSIEVLMGIAKKRLSLMGEGPGGADHLDLICNPADYEETFTTIMQLLLDREEIDLIRFGSLSCKSTGIDLLRGFSLLDGNILSRFSLAETGVCPQIDLSAGWDSVLKKGKRASNFKRRLKNLEKRPDFEFRTVIAPGEVDTAFERFLDLHQKRWEQSGGSELTGHPKLIAFQRDLVTKMAEVGLIRFDEVWLDGECRSSVYGLDDGRSFYYYNSGYDLDYADLSVGLVLIGLSIKNAVERGNEVYDFLRGDESYKYDWANQCVKIVDVSLGRHSLSIAATDSLASITASLKAIGKATLPSGLVGSIASRRRAWRRHYQMSER